MAGAFAKIEAHEDICAVRYEGINNTLADLKDLIKWIIKGLAGIVVALVAWMAVQLYTANNVRIENLEHPAQQGTR